MGKILHIITGLRLGGAEGVLTRLTCATRSHFEHVVVALREEGHFAPILRAGGVRVHVLDIGAKRGVPAGLALLARIIRRERPAIVQTWLYHADLLGGIAARMAGVPTVIWGVRNTNLDAAAISMSTRRVAWIAARLSGVIPNVIVCNSSVSIQAHIAFGYRPRRFRLIANGYDTERFRPDSTLRESTRRELGVAPGELLIGCVARWDAQKDHANLLAAIRAVALRRQAVRAVLVGAGVDAANRTLMRIIEATCPAVRVTLTGARQDIPAIMNALDLHVSPSLGEAFPNAVAEAMACGTPCVVTDVGDSSLIVGDTGWVVPPRDSAALGRAIEAALATIESNGRDSGGGRARARIAETFGMQRMTDAYCALWAEFGVRAG